MSRKSGRNPPGALRPAEAAVREAVGPISQQQTLTLQQESVTVHVQLPPPEMLERYERARPGTMDLLVRWSEEEQAHRREQDRIALQANVESQRRQLDIAQDQVNRQHGVATYQATTIRRSDFIGQLLGWALAAGAIAASVYLALEGHEGVAAVLAALPTAAVIQSFRTLIRQDAKAPPQDPSKGK